MASQGSPGLRVWDDRMTNGNGPIDADPACRQGVFANMWAFRKKTRISAGLKSPGHRQPLKRPPSSPVLRVIVLWCKLSFHARLRRARDYGFLGCVLKPQNGLRGGPKSASKKAFFVENRTKSKNLPNDQWTHLDGKIPRNRGIWTSGCPEIPTT